MKNLVFVGFLIAFVVIAIFTWQDIHRIRNECNRDHGLVVHGQYGEPGVGFSGYVCIEKGKH